MKLKTLLLILLIVFFFPSVCLSVLVLLCSKELFYLAIMYYSSVLFNFKIILLEQYVSRM